MAIMDLFSRRQRVERGEYPDVYQYDEIPQPFRVQAWHIITDALGQDTYGTNEVSGVHQFIADTLLREYGLFQLSARADNDHKAIREFFLSVDKVERALDVIELYFWIISVHVKKYQYEQATSNRRCTPDQAVEQLNRRFKDNGIGYQFEQGKVIRLDSEYLHEEAVRPALKVLSDARFKGANEEFLAAHGHYRHGRNEECLVECCKAFESTMKTICVTRNWPFKATDPASKLITACLDNGLVPAYLEQQLTALRLLFESGIPTVRNKAGGHGQGTEQRDVPEFLARYVLNQTATTILFFVESEAAGLGSTTAAPPL